MIAGTNIHNPAITAVAAESITAAAAISLIAPMAGCCSGVMWSHNLSIAVLSASVTHTAPTRMVAIAHLMGDNDTQHPTTSTQCVAVRCIHVLCSRKSNFNPLPA